MLRVSIDTAAPDPAVLRLAADLIARGGVIAFPTDTFYGLAVDPRRVEAVGALYRIKGRETGQPVALVAASQAQVDACVGRLPELGQRLARRFWPGPLTLVIA
ncbi:MAG: Sua5/YciO/YrdC/YwlC family protein, partial [Acidobacteria bacterium]|nr:Sua5/YciO/YrdC/YwlC family protein [Acidobacteriota bacterium]